MAAPFTVFDHTADVGLRITGATLDALFVNAALGMFSLLCDVNTVRTNARDMIAVDEDDVAYRLHDWLAELLYRFDTDHRLYARFEVRNVGVRAECIAWGERVDPARHELRAEIKAVTAHELTVKRDGGLWTATVIFDL